MSNNPWTGKTVLIIDDSETIRIELSGIYSDLGMRVVNVAKNGIEGITLYKQDNPDFVSLDIIMPEMHGLDCYRKLVAMKPDLRYIFVSCLAGDAGLLAAFDGKIPQSRFVAKPVSYEIIKKALVSVYSSTAMPQHNLEITQTATVA